MKLRSADVDEEILVRGRPAYEKPGFAADSGYTRTHPRLSDENGTIYRAT